MPTLNYLPTILSEALAPVFLITGISGLINIMAQRYGRIIDRIRVLLRDGEKLYPNDFYYVSTELSTLYKRARILRYSLVLLVASVFCISVTVCCLFLDMAFTASTATVAQFFFITSMIFLMISLAWFMRDFMISLTSIKHDITTRATKGVEGID